MKQIHLLIIFFAAYHISSFSSQHTPESPDIERVFKQTKDQSTKAERAANQQKIIEYNNQFSKISQKELDKWVAEKEHEIKENQARYKKEQEQRAFDSYVNHYRKNHRRRNF